MMEEIIEIRKPKLLKIVSLIAFTYHFVFLLIFLSGIIFNRFFTTALENYFPGEIGHHEVLFFSSFGAFMYIISIVGLLYIRKLRRIGLLLYFSSIIIFFTLKFILWEISLVNLVVNSLFITIFALNFKRFN